MKINATSPLKLINHWIGSILVTAVLLNGGLFISDLKAYCDVSFSPPYYQTTAPGNPGADDGSILVYASSSSEETLIEYILRSAESNEEAIIQYEPLFSNLPAGEYIVEVRDAENPLCTGGVKTVSLEAPAPSDLPLAAPSYTGPLYEGDPLQLFANPPDDKPYQFHWFGPNGFISSDENPKVGTVSKADGGNYTVSVFSEEGQQSSAVIPVEVVEEKIGTTYDPISVGPDLYPFEFCSDCCCDEEEENSFDVMPPPKMIMDLSGAYKSGRPKQEGPPGCNCAFNTYTGNFFTQVPVLSIEGLGPELSLHMVYNSCNGDENSGFGNGWTFNYNWYWEAAGPNILIHRGDGRVDEFQFSGGTYLAPNGVTDVLTDLGGKKLLLRSKYGEAYLFEDPDHRRLTKVRDRNLNELTIDFADGFPIRITGACGRSYELEYREGQLQQIIDKNITPSRVVRFEYDIRQNLRKITDPIGHSRKFEYDGEGKIIQLTDRRGSITDVAYNSDRAVSSLKTGLSQLAVIYDKDKRQTRIAQPVGGKTEMSIYHFDEAGRAVQMDGNCCGYKVKYQYNEKNDITTITDALGHLYRYTYDERGNVLTETDPLDQIQEFQWHDQFSQLAHWEDKRDHFSYCTFDPRGNVRSVVFPASGITLNYTYYPNGLLKESTNGEGHTTRLVYNAHGDRIAVHHPIGTETFDYDNIGRITASTNPNGAVGQTSYDALGRPLVVTDPLGHKQENKYDPNGNRIWHKNKKNGITTYEYDAHDRLTKVTRPRETITQYGYDEKGNLGTRTDPEGHTTQYTYGARNRRTAMTNALGHTQRWEFDANGNLIKYTSYNGYDTFFSYDELNRRIRKKDALGNETQYSYDANGNNVSVVSPYGVASKFRYNAMNRLTEVQHPISQFKKTYDKNGNLIKEEDAAGRATHFSYDPNDRLIKKTDALGQEERYQYDDGGNLMVTTDKRGNKTQQVYDLMGRLVERIDALGGSIFNEYDENGNVIRRTDQRGAATNYAYDELDRNIRIQFPVGTQQMLYNKNGKLVQHTDGLGRRTSYRYDAIGQKLQTTYADGSTTKQAFDANGNIVRKWNENNVVTRNSYNAINQLISTTNGEQERIQYQYDRLGHLKSTTLPSGNVIRRVYDQQGRSYASYDQLGTIAQTTYDPAGNVHTQTENGQGSWTYQYDALNRRIATVDPKGNSSIIQYDANGNPTQRIDRQGKVERMSYDALNRQISETDALGYTTVYDYDKVGNLVAITDANGNATTYKYNKMNRRTRETFADGTTKVYVYDEAGNKVKRIDNRGNKTTYTYDSRNRLIHRNYPGANDDQFGYDAAGRIINASNSHARLTMKYDKVGRLLSEDLNGHTTHFSFNSAKRQRTIRYSSGTHKVVETRDQRGRIVNLSRNGRTMVEWKYHNRKRPVYRRFKNGTRSHYLYDNHNRLASITHENTSQAFVHLKYAYDKEGNKQYEEKLHRPDHSEAYAYDDNYRLSSFNRGQLSTGSFQHLNNYSYDALGNRKSWDSDNTLVAYQSNEMNEYTAFSGKPNPAYDDNGNLVNDGQFSYQYDYENRLISVNNGAVARYQYDPLGRRIFKKTRTGTTLFYYDGARVTEEKNLFGKLQASYSYGLGMDDILMMQRNGKDTYYHKNAQGSVVAISNSSGSPVEFYEYDAYGQVKVFNNIYLDLPATRQSNPYFFTGRRLDPETGLYYYRARYYDALHGRFIQRDPLGYFDGMNVYVYAKNNPMRFNDPSGFFSVEEVVKGTISLGLSVGGLLAEGAVATALGLAGVAAGTVFLVEIIHGKTFAGEISGLMDAKEKEKNAKEILRKTIKKSEKALRAKAESLRLQISGLPNIISEAKSRLAKHRNCIGACKHHDKYCSKSEDWVITMEEMIDELEQKLKDLKSELYRLEQFGHEVGLGAL